MPSDGILTSRRECSLFVWLAHYWWLEVFFFFAVSVFIFFFVFVIGIPRGHHVAEDGEGISEMRGVMSLFLESSLEG